MLVCIKCKNPLMEVPVFNDGKDEEYPPTFLFCPNPKCTRHGLLTVTFKNEEADQGDSDKKVQS